MRLKLLSCEVFHREMCAVAARSPNTVDMKFLPKGLHDRGGAVMRHVLQECIDEAEPEPAEAVVLGYGLCNNSLAGLRAAGKPLVVPRAHDCLAILMGGREQFSRYFEKNPGTYFLSSGWLERGRTASQPASAGGSATRGAFGMSWEQLVEQYGEENAAYLVEQERESTAHYDRVAFFRMGVDPDDRFEEEARGVAEEKGWLFTLLPGNLRLLQALVDGDWPDEDFLTVPPEHEIGLTYDDRIIRAVPPSG